MAGRPPKPTQLKKLEGNPGKRHLNDRIEAVTDPLDDLSAPNWLNPDGLTVWQEMAPKLSKAKLLTSVDRQLFAAGCNEFGLYIDAQRKLKSLADQNNGILPTLTGGENGKQPQPHGLLIVSSMALKKAQAIFRDFGVSPVGRRQAAIEVQTDLFVTLNKPNDKAAPSYYN